MVARCEAPGEAHAGDPTSLERLQEQAAAFQALLALDALPQSGREAREAARRLGELVLASAVPPPLLSQLVVEHLEGLPPARPRFVEVSTGLRLRYYEWGSGGHDVVLLLHDCGEAADVWRPLGPRLADRGYRVIAPDLRGHGESGRSLEGRYGADSLAEDVKALIVALDLYVAPVALVGCGMGAAAALALAQQNPFLAGAVLAGEFALPVAALQEAGAPSGNHGDSGGSPEAAAAPAPGQAVRPAVRQAAQAALSSKQLLPWWGFQAGQATAFESIEHCAAFLAHPLANLSPGVVAPLASAATAAADAASAPGSDELSAADAATSVRQLLAQLQRPLRGAVASACSLLRLPPRMAGGGWGSHYLADEGEEQLQPRTDPSLLFHFDAAALLAGLPSLRCHLLLLHGSRGSWVAPADAAATAALAASGSAASAAVAELPGAGHWLATDQPDALLQRIVGFLEGPAIRCFSRAALVAAADGAGHAGSNGADARRPEVLDLKPLPQYASLEEAQKALGPRAIPTAAAVEAELAKLRVEEGRAAGDVSSDEEEEQGGRRATALAKEPADYFGFVG